MPPADPSAGSNGLSHRQQTIVEWTTSVLDCIVSSRCASFPPVDTLHHAPDAQFREAQRFKLYVMGHSSHNDLATRVALWGKELAKIASPDRPRSARIGLEIFIPHTDADGARTEGQILVERWIIRVTPQPQQPPPNAKQFQMRLALALRQLMTYLTLLPAACHWQQRFRSQRSDRPGVSFASEGWLTSGVGAGEGGGAGDTGRSRGGRGLSPAVGAAAAGADALSCIPLLSYRVLDKPADLKELAAGFGGKDECEILEFVKELLLPSFCVYIDVCARTASSLHSRLLERHAPACPSSSSSQSGGLGTSSLPVPLFEHKPLPSMSGSFGFGSSVSGGGLGSEEVERFVRHPPEGEFALRLHGISGGESLDADSPLARSRGGPRSRSQSAESLRERSRSPSFSRSRSRGAGRERGAGRDCEQQEGERIEDSETQRESKGKESREGRKTVGVDVDMQHFSAATSPKASLRLPMSTSSSPLLTEVREDNETEKKEKEKASLEKAEKTLQLPPSTVAGRGRSRQRDSGERGGLPPRPQTPTAASSTRKGAENLAGGGIAPPGRDSSSCSGSEGGTPERRGSQERGGRDKAAVLSRDQNESMHKKEESRDRDRERIVVRGGPEKEPRLGGPFSEMVESPPPPPPHFRDETFNSLWPSSRPNVKRLLQEKEKERGDALRRSQEEGVGEIEGGGGRCWSNTGFDSLIDDETLACDPEEMNMDVEGDVSCRSSTFSFSLSISEQGGGAGAAGRSAEREERRRERELRTHSDAAVSISGGPISRGASPCLTFSPAPSPLPPNALDAAAGDPPISSPLPHMQSIPSHADSPRSPPSSLCPSPPLSARSPYAHSLDNGSTQGRRAGSASFCALPRDVILFLLIMDSLWDSATEQARMKLSQRGAETDSKTAPEGECDSAELEHETLQQAKSLIEAYVSRTLQQLEAAARQARMKSCSLSVSAASARRTSTQSRSATRRGPAGGHRRRGVGGDPPPSPPVEALVVEDSQQSSQGGALLPFSLERAENESDELSIQKAERAIRKIFMRYGWAAESRELSEAVTRETFEELLKDLHLAFPDARKQMHLEIEREEGEAREREQQAREQARAFELSCKAWEQRVAALFAVLNKPPQLRVLGRGMSEAQLAAKMDGLRRAGVLLK
uniref:Uncharacterized protein n=1 Tax=Chromera velia CCMP2878 TaxID=1169474 RepID=A0A0G4GSW6_9ALVE|eukprot:Cvel_23251.t1-p1 / transcript=Cvel_23251.t1 / gene=Cvel_23251 / organism=Chromera_velia_CCMP2878 / gene_product=hypothetical protein / transcript_product=hypothetical protein / location=Cvel_scaffold2376:8168-13586(-) / protein_length=1147 / sequence_SO=supercontig / SO=protein_coding / is_pseudo=false